MPKPLALLAAGKKKWQKIVFCQIATLFLKLQINYIYMVYTEYKLSIFNIYLDTCYSNLLIKITLDYSILTR